MKKFVTSIRCPWALVKAQGDGSPGRRPASRLAWLEFNNGVYFDGWVLGRTWRTREADGTLRAGAHPSGFVRRYKHKTKIAPSDILHTFPHSKDCGPSKREEAAARKALPRIPEFGPENLTTGPDGASRASAGCTDHCKPAPVEFPEVRS